MTHPHARWRRRPGRAAGLSIVELLTVILLMGILAMIVLPRVTGASPEQRSAALVHHVQTVREQIDLYRMQHDGRGPHLDTNGNLDRENLPNRLTGRTNPDGRLNPAGPCGPYLLHWPSNPLARPAVAGKVSFGIRPDPPRDGSTGWYFDVRTCSFSANSVRGAKHLDPPPAE